MGILLTLLLLAIIAAIAYLWQIQRNLTRHFTDRGVDFVTPKSLFGNIAALVFRRKDLPLILKEFHNRFKDKGLVRARTT